MKPAVKYVTWSAIASLAPLIWLSYQMHMAYVEWHTSFIDDWFKIEAPVYTKEQSDSRYAPRADIITLAEANDLKKTIKRAEDLAQSNAGKLDAIQMTSAVQLVIAAEQRVDRLQENPRNTLEWRDSLSDAKSDLSKAKEYRDCIRNRRGNCDSIRVW